VAAAHEHLTLEVATPTGLKLRTEAEAVSAPSVQGEFGVLPNHLPLLAALRCGLLKYTVNGKSHVAAIGPGFVEAEPTKVEVLTDLFALPADIDVAQAREDLADAEEELKKFTESPEDPRYAELTRNVDWANARIEAAAEAEKLS
jgi:F-type H+-transporting ATPase subunit epsilon